MSPKKKYIVTGASRGIGKAISQELIARGHHILGISRTFDWEDSCLEQLVLDLSDLKSLPEKLKTLSLTRLDGIICNAGKGRFGTLEQFSFAQIQNLIELNFLSQVYLIKAFLPMLKRQQYGDIIMIGSEAALVGKRQGSIYCASKFALRGFTQALREECATDHIRICLINPGMVQTSFFDDLSFIPGDAPSEHILPEDIAKTVAHILEGREGTVFDEINLSPQKKRIQSRISHTFSEEIVSETH